LRQIVDFLLHWDNPRGCDGFQTALAQRAGLGKSDAPIGMYRQHSRYLGAHINKDPAHRWPSRRSVLQPPDRKLFLIVVPAPHRSGNDPMAVRRESEGFGMLRAKYGIVLFPQAANLKELYARFSHDGEGPTVRGKCGLRRAAVH